MGSDQTTGASGTPGSALVVVEGPDGCGKTTISSLLGDELQIRTCADWSVVTDPSDGPVGHLIRRWLGSGAPYELEALGYLFFADRIHQLHRWAQPRVVADRYLLSTWVYQRGTLPDDVLVAVLGDERLRIPDVVVHLDVDRDTCLQRLSERAKLDCFDAKERLVQMHERYKLAWAGLDAALLGPRARLAVFGRAQISVPCGNHRSAHEIVEDVARRLGGLDLDLGASRT